MSFRTGLSGLHAAQADLDVTSHNIANASTVGFKTSRTEFVDVFAVSYTGISAVTPGAGVRVSGISQQFAQGNIEYTDNNLDLGIAGRGFFVVKDSKGEYFTRQGMFGVDRDGYVENNFKQRLQIFPPDGLGGFNTGIQTDLQLQAGLGAPQETTTIDSLLNLDAGEIVAGAAGNDIVPTNPATYNHRTALTVYDSLGQAHDVALFFQKTAANTWDVAASIDGGAVSAETAITFDTAGRVLGAPTVNFLFAVTTGATSPINNGGGGVVLDLSQTTQYGSPFEISALSQDGYATGRLSSLDIDDQGVVFARYTNGESLVMGKVALASVPNPQGLRSLGDSLWGASFAAGDVLYGEPGGSNFGLIQAGALEASTVDLADQLVNMIVAQRNFQASAQIITTNDTITQTIVNIR